MVEFPKIACLTVLLLASTSTALLNSTVQWPVYIKYTAVTGYFLQDDPSTNATTFNYVGRWLVLSISDLSLTNIDGHELWPYRPQLSSYQRHHEETHSMAEIRHASRLTQCGSSN